MQTFELYLFTEITFWLEFLSPSTMCVTVYQVHTRGQVYCRGNFKSSSEASKRQSKIKTLLKVKLLLVTQSNV